jgi:hypothetical protein
VDEQQCNGSCRDRLLLPRLLVTANYRDLNSPYRSVPPYIRSYRLTTRYSHTSASLALFPRLTIIMGFLDVLCVEGFYSHRKKRSLILLWIPDLDLCCLLLCAMSIPKNINAFRRLGLTLNAVLMGALIIQYSTYFTSSHKR